MVENFLSVKEFASRTNYAERTIRQKLSDGIIVGHRMERGRKWLIPTSELERLRVTPSKNKQTLESEVATDKKGPQVQVESEEDPLIIEARRQHFIDIQNIGKDLIACLDEFCSLGRLTRDKDILRKLDPIHTKYLQIRNRPLFECLKQHIPDSTLWSYFDQVGDMLLPYVAWLRKMDEDWYLSEMRESLNKDSPDGYWDSLPPEDICIYFAEDMFSLAHAVKDSVTLAISKRVFPGICPACPTDYKTQVPPPP